MLVLTYFPLASIIGAEMLNDSVRNGKRCVHLAKHQHLSDKLLCIQCGCNVKSCSAISTPWLNPLLDLHLEPIKVVVYDQPDDEVSSWGELPAYMPSAVISLDLATRQCPWQDNRYTIGLPPSVLSSCTFPYF